MECLLSLLLIILAVFSFYKWIIVQHENRNRTSHRKKNELEAFFLQSFDLISWIDSKLEHQSSADLYLSRLNILK
jgi:hypothetical protein